MGFSSREQLYNNDFAWPQVLMFISQPALGVIYAFLIFRLVRLNHQKYKDQYAEVNIQLTLDWVKWIILIPLALVGLGTLAISIVPVFSDFPVILFPVLSILFICATISFFAFRQPTLYQEEVLPEVADRDILRIEEILANASDTSIASPDPKNNISLSEVEKGKLVAQLEQYMREHKPYLSPKIRMSELAKALHIPRYLFSYLINEHYQMNFFYFINQYRIAYAKKLLAEKESQSQTLESISQMAGFNSKTTCNTRFKEMVGQSPKAYQNQHM